MQKQNRNLLILALGAAALLCMCCFLVVVSAGIASRMYGNAIVVTEDVSVQVTKIVTRVVTATPGLERDATPGDAMPQPQGTPESAAPDEGADTGVSVGPNYAMNPALVELPERDLRQLALALKPGVTEIPEVVNPTPPSYKVGDTEEFWVSNSDTQEHFKVRAVLRYVTPHVYMWVEEGARLDQADLEASAERFEAATYPTNREFFGSEWTPGVDNDPHLSILHARNLGSNIAGYYSSADEFSRLVNPYSNEREMFYISVDQSSKPNSSFYDGTLAHEFQHMIHWANDRNEDSWVNEGMSELAGFLNGYDPGGADMAYAQLPDTQLTTWADPSVGNIEHYGASYLFMAYFLDRFGEDLTKAVVSSPRNGTAGFNEALEQAGRPERFDDIFADWVVANYLDRPEAAPVGDYGYSEIDPNRPVTDESYRRFPVDNRTTVSQYGVDYTELRGGGGYTIDFEGQAESRMVDADLKGQYSWWSNRGDDSDSRLTRTVDLTGVDTATLNFSTWYNIEEGWDYAYVAVSTDGGDKWQLLPGRYTTDDNPVGNAFGVGWTGISGGGSTPEWVEERVDLTLFAGQEVLLRFEYVTDDAVNEAGFLLDDISIPEIGYVDDGEGGPVGWESAGWLLTDNRLAQNWLVQLVRANGNDVSVDTMQVGPDGRGQLTVDGIGSGETVFMTVSGLTQFTTEPADYSYAIQENK